MDGFTEKKWFVYLGDHHEGPFSLEDIQGKMNHGQLTATNYVWAEGMGDWKPMPEIQAFEAILNKPAAPAPMMAAPSGPELSPILTSGDFSAISLEPAATSTSPILSSLQPAHSLHEAPQANTFANGLEAAPLSSKGSANGNFANGNFNEEPLHDPTMPTMKDALDSSLHDPSHKKALVKQMLKFGALFLVLGGFGIAFNEGYFTPLFSSQTAKSAVGAFSSIGESGLQTLADKIPFLGNLISPIPKLTDVTPEEYSELQGAAKAKLDQSGPQLAIAVSKSDLLTPNFYVASNLPDGAIVDVYLEGVSDTLLSQLSFSAKAQATITKKIGKTGALTFSKGQALPRGQYTVYVVDPETQSEVVKPLISKMTNIQVNPAPATVPKGFHVIATKGYFLGGPRDGVYSARLKEFHDKLAAKAAQEITELKQISETLESQLADTDQKFTSLKKGKKLTPKQKTAWGSYHAKWDEMTGQLSQTFAKLTPDALENDYFYGFLYVMAQKALESLNQLHVLQNSYFTGAVTDLKAFEIQLGETVAVAHSTVESLKSRIDQIEKLPPSPNGLPKRDGI